MPTPFKREHGQMEGETRGRKRPRHAKASKFYLHKASAP